ncbi:thiamine pyrophosphate-binding protein [Roseburia sp. 831b]|uniref:thiamine pyrophosphate-binding protein n=1 Tax=Roseburia sp. 831b TaxID=1261635 RepID=UPI0009518AC9|nr:thiamine pyrophosphate-binding protein [Roseburia sp. 831b]WVK72831.1 thiamine pyrophosphate-binding protein [Roseburia sp. 831b]
MRVADYFALELKKNKVTDIFGIPGGVLLPFLYAVDACEGIEAHLNFHEQAAGYAACGYAQGSGRLGVAYATKGPGIMNMMTPIAEAYYDSIPVLFITAHANEKKPDGMRFLHEQEMDLLSVVKGITKYAARVDDAASACREIKKACRIAQEGRKGPVLLDVSAKVLKQEMEKETDIPGVRLEKEDESGWKKECEKVADTLCHAKRPILLIGDGMREKETTILVREFAEKRNIPVLSSRVSQDLLVDSQQYYGYIGSHGIRYSNFILSKADFILALGNRMSFPAASESFRPIVEKADIVRVDIDATEFQRVIPNCKNIRADVKDFIMALEEVMDDLHGDKNWSQVCDTLREKLKECDMEEPQRRIASILNEINEDATIVCDVGNSELWFSRAFAYTRKKMTILSSKSFKTVGCALAKAIGVYYETQKPVICMTGDQGLQFNIQELQFISQNHIPITIVVYNNHSSGMMRSSEQRMGYSYFLQTTEDSGFGMPKLKDIARAYQLEFFDEKDLNQEALRQVLSETTPKILQLEFQEEYDVKQVLPKGNPCQKFLPELEEHLYRELDDM